MDKMMDLLLMWLLKRRDHQMEKLFSDAERVVRVRTKITETVPPPQRPQPFHDGFTKY